MRSPTLLVLALVAPLAAPPRAAPQQPQSNTPDMAWRLRVAAFKSLQTGSTIRISSRDIGLRTGTVSATGDSALTLDGAGRVPYSGIDSVWIRRNHATAGLLIGTAIGTVVGLMVASGQHCDAISSNCINTAAGEFVGITLGGALAGALVGAASPSWKPRYP